MLKAFIAPSQSASMFESLSPSEAADAVASVPAGTVCSLAGITPGELLSLIDQLDFAAPSPLVLFVDNASAASAQGITEKAVLRLAAAALRVWPAWYDGAGIDFGICQNDALGRKAIAVLAKEVARNVAGVQRLWTEKAALAALRGRAPLAGRFPLREQLEQLAKAIAPNGLVLVISFQAQEIAAEASVHALEWLAQSCGVVALFDVLPANEPPFERILQHAVLVRNCAPAPMPDAASPEAWLSPWRGSPHPLSGIEKKMAAMLSADEELGSLFAFNRTVATERGSRPKVDLLWSEGRLVVELDGYESHGGRTAFAHDRHRDYELMVSGYAVLRLSNDEIAQDCEKALEKIRDLVRLRRQTMTKEV